MDGVCAHKQTPYVHNNMTTLQMVNENEIFSRADMGELAPDALDGELGEGPPDTCVEDFDDLSATAAVAEGAA